MTPLRLTLTCFVWMWSDRIFSPMCTSRPLQPRPCNTPLLRIRTWTNCCKWLWLVGHHRKRHCQRAWHHIGRCVMSSPSLMVSSTAGCKFWFRLVSALQCWRKFTRHTWVRTATIACAVTSSTGPEWSRPFRTLCVMWSVCTVWCSATPGAHAIRARSTIRLATRQPRYFSLQLACVPGNGWSLLGFFWSGSSARHVSSYSRSRFFRPVRTAWDSRDPPHRQWPTIHQCRICVILHGSDSWAQDVVPLLAPRQRQSRVSC